MFAIIETGGKQYKIEKGQTLDIERIEKKEGEEMTFDKILLIGDKDSTKVGTPIIDGAYAKAKIVTHKRGDKIIVFKMKAKKRYQKKQGHRQELTTIEITDVKASGGKPAPKTTPKKEETEVKAEKAPKKPVAKKPAPKKTPIKKEETK